LRDLQEAISKEHKTNCRSIKKNKHDSADQEVKLYLQRLVKEDHDGKEDEGYDIEGWRHEDEVSILIIPLPSIPVSYQNCSMP
jgi:hypothetical protein